MNLSFKKIFFCSIFLLLINACSTKNSIKTIETTSFQLNANSQSDTSFEKIIEPYRSSIENEMNQVLIVSESSAEKGNPEGKLGNITCDMILKKANDYATQQNLKAVDFCLLNNGGLRAPLPKGPITKGKVFELMPFENELVVLTLTGKKTKQLFETVAKEKGMPIGGARIFVQDSAAPSIQIGGKDFDESKSYRVVTSDYLSAGGDKMFFFKAPEMVDTLHRKLRDAIIEYMVEENKIGHTLNPQIDGRITYKK